jgi:hypothetical protein
VSPANLEHRKIKMRGRTASGAAAAAGKSRRCRLGDLSAPTHDVKKGRWRCATGPSAYVRTKRGGRTPGLVMTYRPSRAGGADPGRSSQRSRHRQPSIPSGHSPSGKLARSDASAVAILPRLLRFCANSEEVGERRHRLKQARTNNRNRRKAISRAPNRFGRHRLRQPEAEVRRDRRSRTEKMKPYLMLLFIGSIMALSGAVGSARQSSRRRLWVLDIIRNSHLFRGFS